MFSVFSIDLLVLKVPHKGAVTEIGIYKTVKNNFQLFGSFRSVSSATDEKADPGKAGKVEKGAYYGTREEWITDKKQ